MKRIADSGFLIALLDRLDEHHAWAAGLVDVEPAPYLVCEAVCAEVGAVLGTAKPLMQMLQCGDLVLDFSLRDNLPTVTNLLHKYRDQGMDLADACVVCMSEIHRAAKVLTVDATDFAVYRRFGNREIPRITPPHATRRRGPR